MTARSSDAGGSSTTILPCPVRSLGGQGPALVLIHGFGADRMSWIANVPALTAASTVFSLDLPGHGSAGTEVGGGAVETLAAAVEAALDEHGLQDATLVGHSLGGGIALLIAARRPDLVGALVLMAPIGFGRGVDPAFLHDYPLVQGAAETEALLHRLVTRPRLINKQLVAIVQTQLALPGARDALTKVARGIEAAGPALAAAIEQVTRAGLPRLLIWGEDDQINPPDRRASEAFGGDTLLIPDTGHLPHIEAAPSVNAAIGDFLCGHRR